jgi:hypothetical protein
MVDYQLCVDTAAFISNDSHSNKWRFAQLIRNILYMSAVFRRSNTLSIFRKKANCLLPRVEVCMQQEWTLEDKSNTIFQDVGGNYLGARITFLKDLCHNNSDVRKVQPSKFLSPLRFTRQLAAIISSRIRAWLITYGVTTTYVRLEV